MKRQFLLLFFALLLATLSSWATVRNVPADYLTIQDAVAVSVDGDVIQIANGTYFLTAPLYLNHELTITGASEAGVIINTTGTPSSSWGINPNKSNTSLSNFTIVPNGIDGGFPIHVGDNMVPVVISNVTLSHITINGAKKTAFDFNGVDNLTLSYLTATNTTGGNGIQVSGCKNVNASYITTSGNAWGGFAIYCSKPLPNGVGRGSSNVTIDGTTSTFGEATKIYSQDEFGYFNTNTTVTGFDYSVQNPIGLAGYALYKSDFASALATASTLASPQNSTVKQVSNGQYWVGPGITVSAAVNASLADGVVNVNSGTYTEASTINLNKAISIIGATSPTRPVILTAGTTQATYLFNVSASGVIIKNLDITKTNVADQNIIYVGGSNFVLDNCKVHGQYTYDDGTVCRAMVTTGGLSGLQITNNEFYSLRQPAYISGPTTGIISNNLTYGTKGWVLEQGNMTFTGNTWGVGSQANVFDIAILSSVLPAYYPDIVAMSAANNNAVIEDQRVTPRPLSVVYVDKNSTQTEEQGSLLLPYKSIAPAITRVVTGGTIRVAVGTYNESPTINKSLSLLGAGRDETNIVLQTAPNYTGSLLVGGANVTVSGFTITGFDAVGSGLASTNIYLNPSAANVNISNNRLLVGKIGSGTTGDDGFGLITEYSEPATPVSNLTVTGNIFQPVGTEGQRTFYINPGVNNFTFTNNTITGQFKGTAITQAKNGLIENNTINATGSSMGFGTYGDPDAAVYGKTEFRNNAISGVARGIAIYGANNVVIENNTLSNNVDGVWVGYDVPNFNPATISISNNNITGSTGYGVNNTTPTLINATCNWWGTAIASEIAAKISSKVTYAPYSVSEGGACTGYPPPTPGISLITKTLTPCGPFDVDVKVSDFKNIGAISLELDFASSVLDYLSTTSNGAVSSAIINEDLGHIVLGWNSQDAINLNDNDVLFTLHFALKPAAVGGSTTNLVWDKANCEIAGIGTNRPIYTSTYNDLVETIPARPVVLTGTGVHLEYCTIQAAIDAAVNGNTITVAAGTYPENVIVNKDVTLLGANAGISCSGRVTESTIAGNGGTAVAVESDGVTIDGFEITNPTGPFAITATSRNNLLFQNNNINTIGTVGAVSNVHAIAIVMGSTNTDKVDILDNCISNIGNSGNGGSASGIGAGWSTATTDITNLVIAGNTVSAVNASRGAYGIMVGVGAKATGQATGAIIQSNTISALTGKWAHAIGLEGNTPGAVVQNNLVYSLLSETTPGDAVAVKIEDNSGAATVGIHNNSFAGMSIGIYNASSGQADATCNWYGTGVTKIYGAVTNIPWLTSDVNTIVSGPGFAPSVACVECTMALSETHVDVACVSGTDGSINLTVANGVAPLAYSWTGSAGFTSALEDLATLAAGTYNVTVTAANGCSATKEVVIGNADAQAPVVTTCPPTLNLEGCSTAAITDLVYSETLVELSASAFTSTGGVATDNCAVASASYIDTKTGSCPIVVTRTWKVVDTNGNPSSTCEQTINIRDLTAPAITLPAANLSMTCFDAAQVDAWIATASATDVCSGPATVVPTYTAPTSSCNQTVVVTFKAKDACNNEATLTKSFTVNDNIAPELTVPVDAVVDCPNPTTPATTGTATATDNCGTPTVSYSDVAGQLTSSTFPGGTAIQGKARWGKTGYEAALFIGSTQGPALFPAGTPVWVIGTSYAFEYSYDVASGNQTLKIDFNNDLSYGAGEVITQATSYAGQSFKHFSIFMSGDATRGITLNNFVVNGVSLGNYVSPATGNIDKDWENSDGYFGDILATGTITFTGTGVPYGSDETGRIWFRTATPVTPPVPPVACASNYTINRVWTATDACGNKSMKVQNIQVRDITAPTWLTQPGEAVTINCPATPVFTAPTAIDGCDASPVITFTDVTVNGACAGTYTITRTWTATDACGNASTTVSQAITVQDITAPVLTGQGADASIFCPAVPVFTAPTAADGCDTAPVITHVDVTTPEGATVAPYSVTRTWTATDACGNHSSVSQTISVVKATLSGTMVYNNSGKTPISGVTLQLNPGGALVTTDADGKYSFAGLCTGDYTIAVTDNIWKEGGVNSTDAGEVNSWSANEDVIEWVRFMSGDVNNDQYITSGDALKIQRKYVYRSAESDYLRGTWVYWKQDEVITSNELPARPLPTTIQVHVGGNVNNFNLYANCTGDFNGSFTPSILKSTSSNLSLNNNSMMNASANQEFELPIRAASAMQVGAVSMSLIIPSNLVTVQDVLVNGSAVSAVWVVEGDELRIGWFAKTPVSVAENGKLITLKLKTTNAFTTGQTMEFALKFDPLNELANGENKVIPNAGLLVAQVSNGTGVTGIINPFDNQNLSLSNYPNPFKGFTTVDYKLPVQGKVNITVYNQLGQTVQTLIDANQNAGEYSIRMDANSLMPGIYIAKLRLTNSNVNMTGTVKLSVLK